MLAPSVAHEEHDSIILLPVVHQEPQSAFEPFGKHPDLIRPYPSVQSIDAAA